MTASLLAWVRMLDGPSPPKTAWLFETVVGRKPDRVELAAWTRWLALATDSNGAKLDREVQRVMLRPGPGAA